MYYSPILFSQVADVNLTQYHNNNYNMEVLNKKERIIVFALHSMVFLNKLNNFLDNICVPWVIVSAMEDTQLPLEINKDFMIKVLSNKHFKHWFSINKTIPNDRHFTSIPYGLNYWTLSTKSCFGENKQNFETQNNSLLIIKSHTQHFSKRIPKIYCNFHLNCTDERNGNYRSKLTNILPSNLTYLENHWMPRTQSWKNMGEYTFVLSPFGHGFDCIRTFEALCLGCIVIMKKSFLDVIYTELPVLVVNEWEDITEVMLKQTIIDFSGRKFNYKKLTFEYWLHLIQSKF